MIQKITIPLQGEVLSFGNHALRLAPLRRGLPFDSSLRAPSRKYQFMGNLPDTRALERIFGHPVEDREEQCEPSLVSD